MRRLWVPGVSTAAMLLVLVGLGTWQVQRLAWKTALLAEIDRAEAAPAIPLGDAPAQFAPAQFAKVLVRGRYRAGLAGLYGAEVRDTRGGPQLGGRVLAVLDRDGAAPLLVDRGWIAVASGAAIASLPTPPAGPVAVEGFVRQPEHAGPFAAPDDPAARRFYTLDPAKIGAALGVPGIAPFALVAIGTRAGEGDPIPATALPRPPNDHLSYAITWYGLAVVLLVVFVLFVRRNPGVAR